MNEKEKPVVSENPHFQCKQCGSHDVWYTTSETFDGAYDRYHYRCACCKKLWSVTSEVD